MRPAISILLCQLVIGPGVAQEAAFPATGAPLLALHCGHLIDTAAGRIVGPTTVVIDGKRVREVVAGHTADN